MTAEIVRLLDEYFALQKQIHDYFCYVEDWRVIPLDDARKYFWRIEGGEGRGGSVRYANVPGALDGKGEEEVYENEIYTQRHLPKWVYRGAKYTMICADTRTDGNVFLQVFDNAKEVLRRAAGRFD